MSAVSAVERWGLIGHDGAVEHLASSLTAGRIPHAILITGPEGVGRGSLAMALARALNCSAAPDARPCNTCDSCRRVARGAHPDVMGIDLEWQERMIPRKRGEESRRQRLSIDAMRWLRADIASRPIQGRWKTQIIADAALLTDAATNAFLKTLEEPPPFAVIVLLAETEDALSETLLSRCQRLALGPVPAAVIRAALLDRGVGETAAGQIASAARGRPGWALRMAAEPDRFGNRRNAIEAAFEQLSDRLQRVAVSGTIARDHVKHREQTFEALDYWTGLWRDALLYRLGLAEQTAFPEVGDRLSQYARQFRTDDLCRALWATRRCASDLESNVNARVALHAMVMQWPE
ncbi:MAG TPA: hypothetical protein VMM78_17275 [Thermomicrobiales bacterium]|nr:hypothetical protein [Thermomicrobiales bacterium]